MFESGTLGKGRKPPWTCCPQVSKNGSQILLSELWLLLLGYLESTELAWTPHLPRSMPSNSNYRVPMQVQRFHPQTLSAWIGRVEPGIECFKMHPGDTGNSLLTCSEKPCSQQMLGQTLLQLQPLLSSSAEKVEGERGCLQGGEAAGT